MSAARICVLAGLALAGCGGHGAIFLTIEGRGPLETLRLPQDLDALHCVVTTAAGERALLEKDFALNGEQQFPLTLGLEPANDSTARVRIALVGRKAEQDVVSAEALVAMNPGEVTSVTMVLTTQDL